MNEAETEHLTDTDDEEIERRLAAWDARQQADLLEDQAWDAYVAMIRRRNQRVARLVYLDTYTHAWRVYAAQFSRLVLFRLATNKKTT